MGKASREPCKAVSDGYAEADLRLEVAKLQKALLEAKQQNCELHARVKQLQEQVSAAQKIFNHEPDEEEKAAAYCMYILKSYLAACFRSDRSRPSCLVPSPERRQWRHLMAKQCQAFLGFLAMLMAITLHGCSDEAAVEQAREEAIKEGEALKGVQDAISEYKEQKEKAVSARDNVQAKKDSFNKVLEDEGRKAEGDEAEALQDADKILKEQTAAEQAANAVEKGEKPPGDDAKGKDGGSSLMAKQPRSHARSKGKLEKLTFLSPSHIG
eukprot:s4065_g2.t1